MARWSRTSQRMKREIVLPAQPLGACLERKQGFLTRKDAKRWARSRGITGQQPYSCPHDGCDLVHLGILPALVVAGNLARADLTVRKKPRVVDYDRPRLVGLRCLHAGCLANAEHWSDGHIMGSPMCEFTETGQPRQNAQV